MARFLRLPPRGRVDGAFSAPGSFARRAALGFFTLFASVPAADAAVSAQDTEFFESRIRPLFIQRCFDCHSGTNTKGGLSLDSKEGWQTGGDSGPAVIPGNPDESLLIRAVRFHDPDLRMPPEKKEGKLPDQEIALLEEWVRRGAPDPRQAAARIGGMNAEEARGWWAFQPLPDAAAPLTSEQIDSLIDTRLREAGLKASPPADKRTLILRATLDLTGLRPTPEEVEAFGQNDSPAAYSDLVDNLLARPAYGEKWGRHWLDVVRYADSLDSRSFNSEGDILDAWRYRDWVVEAFNTDLPYDRFITEQIAGDILAARNDDPRLIIPTGVYAIGNWGNGDADKEKVHTDIVDDQIDLTSRAFLGMTIACARCHDHKSDAFTTEDYYGLAGFFFSSRILTQFSAKTEGEKLMRVNLLTNEEKSSREQTRLRLAQIENALSNQLTPLDETVLDVDGNPGLTARRKSGVGNPSLTINTATVPVRFSTIDLPARSIALHPGPEQTASAVWRSPVDGRVRVQASVHDADPNGGDGIVWSLRQGEMTLHTAEMDNGGEDAFETAEISVRKGEILQLLIRPRGEYTFDTTRIEFRIEDTGGTQTWDLRKTLLNHAKPEEDPASPWAICSGEGLSLSVDTGLAAEKETLLTSLNSALTAHGLQEGGIPQTRYEGFHDAPVHKRGRYDTLGETVPRRLPAVVSPTQPVIAENSSGRLELAAWIASPRNPLTARVMVNRIWQHHFGEGLVRTPNNLGKLGMPPSHPELLDALAAEFVRSGWSVKHMHRLIMNTAAYRRSSTPEGTVAERDPENVLLPHQRRRRLLAEELRDTILQVSGSLNTDVGGKSEPDIQSPRRTLYITSVRSDRAGFRALFDGADPNGIVDKRTESTVAPQSLFLLNHPLTLAQAAALAEKAQTSHPGTADRVRWLWRQIFQRAPTDREMDSALEILDGDQPDFSADSLWTAFCQMLLCSNEFCYVD